jgi:putative intracellular protease/amidase
MKHALILLFVLLCSSYVGQTQTKRAAFLISDGTLPLDYAGAYEVLGQARMKTFTIAKTLDTVKLSSNMRILPNYSISNAPEFDILVVPSSFDDDTAVIQWIKQKANNVEYILTVCGGVTPVYDAGLLDGKIITSYGPLIDHLKAHAKNATVVTDKRFVDNGKIITCGSYVSGIDGALYLVSKIYGEPRAQEVANNIEYNWDKEYKYVRAKLADNWLAPLLDFGPPLDGKVLTYEGDETQWTAEYEVTRRESFKEFYSQIPEMAEMHYWNNLDTKENESVYSSTWTRKDLDKRDWVCTITMKIVNGQTYSLKYEIERRN